MTIKHIASLYFESGREYAKKRLQKLKSAQLLTERPRKQFEPSLLFLTRNGLSVLKAHGILDLYPSFEIADLVHRARVSDMTLQHELAVLDLKVAFYTAAREQNISILNFSTWPLLHQFKVSSDVVKPDAFARVRETAPDGSVREHSFYIELDRSTEGLATLCDRARSYALHKKSIPHSKETFSYSNLSGPFRVLYVLLSKERRDNVAHRLRTMTPPILSLVSLSTFAEVLRDPFNAIWVRPVDYKNPLRTTHRLLSGVQATAKGRLDDPEIGLAAA